MTNYIYIPPPRLVPYLSTTTSLLVLQRWTLHILTNNGPTVQETMPYILGGERVKLKGQTHVDIKAMGSRPPATREDVGAWIQRIQQKWNKQQRIPKRNNTNSGYSSWFVSCVFFCFVLFSSCHLCFWVWKQPLYLSQDYSFVKGNARKSKLWPHDPTCTVWTCVGQVSKRSSACRLAIRRRESANMVVLPKGSTLQIDAWFLEATCVGYRRVMGQWNWCFLMCFFDVWKKLL